MKHMQHFTCGIIAGIMQYLLITGLSYLLLLLQMPNLLMIALFLISHALVIFVAGWNIFYKVHSFASMVLRITASVVAYVIALLACAHFGVTVTLEELLQINSGAQNAQGIILLSFLFWTIFISVFMITVKSIALRKNGK